MRVGMRMRAALARAVTVVAAAGPLRAVVIVVALARIDADPVLAGATSIAIAVAAAFRADVFELAEAADEAIAAVILLGAIGSREGDRAARFPFIPAAVGLRRADTGIADLAAPAVIVAAAFRAIVVVAGGAAEEIVATGGHLHIVEMADSPGADAAIRLVDAHTGIAHAAATAIVIAAAFLAGAAAIELAAHQVGAAFELRSGAGLRLGNALRAFALGNADVVAANVVGTAEEAAAARFVCPTAAGADGIANIVTAFLLVGAGVGALTLDALPAIAIVAGAACADRDTETEAFATLLIGTAQIGACAVETDFARIAFAIDAAGIRADARSLAAPQTGRAVLIDAAERIDDAELAATLLPVQAGLFADTRDATFAIAAIVVVAALPRSTGAAVTTVLAGGTLIVIATLGAMTLVATGATDEVT